MYQELERLLEGRASPELASAIHALDATIVNAGFTMHREELDYLMSNVNSVDGLEVLLDVSAIMRAATAKVLESFEVEVSDETPINMLIGLVTFLSTFGPSDNNDTIDSIIKASHASDETLCDILELVTEYSAEDYLPYIVSVGDNLIRTIESRINEDEQTDDTLEDIPTETKVRINRYRSQHNDEFMQQIEQDGVPVGVDMEQLYKFYSERLIGEPVNVAIKNLVYMTLMSGVSNEALTDEAAFFIDELYPDVDKNQQAIVLLRKEIASLEGYVLKDD